MTYRITREEAIKELNYYRHCLDFQFGWFGEYDNKVIDMAIKALQTEGAHGIGRHENAIETAQGKWIKEYNGNGWDDFWDYTCSNCGKKYERASDILYYANFCPNCGKRMEKISEK